MTAEQCRTAGGIGVTATDIDGLLLITPRPRRDDRGWFSRTYCAVDYAALGLDHPLVQENQSRSRRGVIRGLHVRADLDEAKFVRVVRGSLFDVVVDLRPRSRTFLQVRTFELNDEDPRHLRVPPGCAHGFQALSAEVDVLYGVDVPYNPVKDVTLAWNDPLLGIRWPLPGPILSERDREAPSVSALRPRFDDWFGGYGPAPGSS
ncbi:dTDP-4-dehydrorhamnose 3,5-epimerase [Streptomyces alanosinicus]|uniref:dTDP-4-dehydrorhamnose 3,5-epimerase n=1 Tax=Streptomyces alanosinicus TaxID=68171 RepID=A0A919D1L9_9ACTN|nr:dTDP-4-dehydrorhamnose 3,5-epimerase [Streptomyces alanosinicus]GHE01647.1 dTDP-4-dehydrorhamnose 3,5-epimerase [Streptomyces alanosinicus]